MQGLMVELKLSGELIIERVKVLNLLGNKSDLVLTSAHSTFLHYINRGLKYAGGKNMEELKKTL